MKHTNPQVEQMTSFIVMDVLERANELQKQGIDIIHLEVGEPDFDVPGFEIVRQYYNLVDEHYRTKKQVQDYADMLHKSPKTLSNIFSTCKLPSPLRVIHERVEAEAKRLLLYSNKSAKEIADILGFEDQASFSRFFKNMTGQSAVQFRNTQEGKN